MMRKCFVGWLRIVCVVNQASVRGRVSKISLELFSVAIPFSGVRAAAHFTMYPTTQGMLQMMLKLTSKVV